MYKALTVMALKKATERSWHALEVLEYEQNDTRTHTTTQLDFGSA